MKRSLTGVLFLLLSTCGLYAQEVTTATFTVDNDPKFIVSANFNYAYRLAKIDKSYSDIQRQYLKNLKTGLSYDISAYYMVSDFIGVGLKFNSYNSSERIDDADIIAPNGDSGFGSIADDVTISFYGVGAIYNLLERGSKHVVNMEVALGYMGYKNDAYALGDYKFKGSTFGASLSVSYQYMAFENFSIGPKLGLVGGALRKVDLTGPDGYNETIKLNSENAESLSRLDMGIVASYRF